MSESATRTGELPVQTTQIAENKLYNSGPKFRTDRIRHAVELAQYGASEAEIAAALGISPERAAEIAEIVTWERKVATA